MSIGLRDNEKSLSERERQRRFESRSLALTLGLSAQRTFESRSLTLPLERDHSHG
jgi:hypothetical protein